MNHFENDALFLTKHCDDNNRLCFCAFWFFIRQKATKRFSMFLFLQAYIKLERYKEAIMDCEWALKVEIWQEIQTCSYLVFHFCI